MPSNTERYTPPKGQWDGQLCLPEAFTFEGRKGTLSNGSTHWEFYVMDKCTANSDPSGFVYECTPSGAPVAKDGGPGNGPIAICGKDPLKTRLDTAHGGDAFTIGEWTGPLTNTDGVTSMDFFYCATGDTLAAPPAVSDVSCSRPGS